MVAARWTIKVLDFGLGQVTSRRPHRDSEALTVTTVDTTRGR